MAQEPWLSGPVEGVPAPLMPIVHSLLQIRQEAAKAAEGLSVAQLWHRPAGAASAGFHLRHLAGTLDRLFTYARGSMLTDEQLATLRCEAEPGAPPATAAEMVAFAIAGIDRAIEYVKSVDPDTLLEHRDVGRKRLPSTVLGLLSHGAEHAQRHTGQLIVTCRVARAEIP